MTPREKFTAIVDDGFLSLTAAERLMLKAAGDEYAAAMVECHAHPPYRAPLRIDVGQARARAAGEEAAPGGAA